MIKINTDHYLNAVSAMEDMPSILKSYIPTDYDLERMEEDPDRYMDFMNYLLSVDRTGINFDDESRERLKQVEKKINAIIADDLELV